MSPEVTVEEQKQKIAEQLLEQGIDFEPDFVRNFFTNNIVKRTLANLLAQYGGRPIRLEATSTGALKVSTVGVAPPTALKGATKTIAAAGTRERLIAVTTPCTGVTIKALAGNTGDVYVGTSDVDATHGIILDAGEAISFDIDDAYKIYLDVSVNGEGVSYLYVV